MLPHQEETARWLAFEQNTRCTDPPRYGLSNRLIPILRIWPAISLTIFGHFFGERPTGMLRLPSCLIRGIFRNYLAWPVDADTLRWARVSVSKP